MTPLRKRMIEDLTIRNYSPRTVKHYTGHVAAFARYYGKSPEQLGPEHIRGYQVYLIHEKKTSWSNFNNTVCALRFFYRVTLKKDWIIEHLPYGKRPKRLPVVLSQEEVQRLFAAMPNLSYRVMLMTAYSAGLRVSEVARLKVEDLDRSRMLIRVRQGKGRKDRYVPLSAVLLEVLCGYAKLAQPSDWLFPGQRLGHARLDTTTIYTHVTEACLRSTKSPLDLLSPIEPPKSDATKPEDDAQRPDESQGA